MNQLTARQRQIAILGGSGLTNVQIGSRLGISPKTVQHILQTVYHKTGISGRYELTIARLNGVLGEHTGTSDDDTKERGSSRGTRHS
jgi:DNA-binding CsgD family transcriptional regulator